MAIKNISYPYNLENQTVTDANKVMANFNEAKSKVNAIVSEFNTALPGEIRGFGGSSAPTGWLICDGSAISRSAYSALFAVIGTSFGAGNGSTTFNIPDARGKVMCGYNSTDANFNSIGKTGGGYTANLAHTHTVASHLHTVNSHAHTVNSHAHGGITTYNGEHNHSVVTYGHAHAYSGITANSTETDKVTDDGTDQRRVAQDPHSHAFSGTTSPVADSGYTSVQANHEHYVYAEAPATNASAPNTTASAPLTDSQLSSAQSLMQPYFTANYIIKT
jgi:microcystin-dependent protein